MLDYLSHQNVGTLLKGITLSENCLHFFVTDDKQFPAERTQLALFLSWRFVQSSDRKIEVSWASSASDPTCGDIFAIGFLLY